MSAITSTTVNQATLIYGRQVPETPPVHSSSNMRYSYGQGCSPQGQLVPTRDALLSEQDEEITFALPSPAPPDRYYSEITKIVATWSLHTARPSMNPYEQEEEVPIDARRVSYIDSWQPRGEMFDVAMEAGSSDEPFNGVVTLSIDPVDGKEGQLLYYGFRLTDVALAATRTLSHRSVDFSKRRADRDNPPPVLQGLFDPHPHYGCSSSLYTPEFGPSYPPDVDAMFLETPEDIGPFTADITRADLRARVERIAAAFIRDVHARAIVVTARDVGTSNDSVKTKYFLKRNF